MVHVPLRALVGGNWDNRSNCGSRSANLNNLSSNRNANYAGQGTSDTGKASKPISLGWVHEPWLTTKIHNGRNG